MRLNFGGLGAWGMFAALIAVCALMFTVTDASEKKNDLNANCTWSAEAPTTLLIVSVVEVTVDAVALCGYQLALNDERHQTQRLGVTATVLLLHQVAVADRSMNTRKNHLRHCASLRQRAGPHALSHSHAPNTNRVQITASTSARRYDRRGFYRLT